MQGRPHYENLLRAVGLANQKRQPYVPYDARDLNRLPLHVALDIMPVDCYLGKDSKWSHYVDCPIKEVSSDAKAMTYSDFVDALGGMVADISHISIGIMVLPNKTGFTVYYLND